MQLLAIAKYNSAMKILFEEYAYQTKDVKDILGGFVLSGLDLEKTEQQLRYVGYFFNNNIENSDGAKGDLVFILPKVILDEHGLAFGLKPESIINFNFKDWKNEEYVVEGRKLTKQNVYDFIYGFATWIYRAVDIYRRNLRSKPKDEQDENSNAEVITSVQVGSGSKLGSVTFMDILLSLIDYQRTHENFVTFVMKMAHSGFNKISWPKTIGRTQAIVQDGSPIYLNPINKKRVVNFDEELLIIYFSILNYIHEEYGFPIPDQPGYDLIKGAMFKSYLKNQGKLRLQQIRYKYYSDDSILLWNLCYAFFDKLDKTKGLDSRKDYLLVNKFETVFEGMIDELIGDKNLPEGLKVGADDKRIDHLYTYKYLLENLDDRNSLGMSKNMYNIADSKYYRRDKKLRGHDEPKQFTYARNVIQWHMDLLHDLLDTDKEKAERYKDIPLFDEITEGYNIIPNFFISGYVDEELNYDKANFERKTNEGEIPDSFFFWERLFDRNTYFTLHYDLNFLFILKMYAQNKSYNKEVWKQKVRKAFREDILEYLNQTFAFYQIKIKSSEIVDFVEKHYRKIAGKVFSFVTENNNRVLLYAERKEQRNGHGRSYTFNEDNDSYVTDDKILIIPERKRKALYRVSPISLGKSAYTDVDKTREEYAIVGYYKDQSQLDWILEHGLYNMRTMGRGRDVRLTEAQLFATTLILHNDQLGNRIFRISGDTLYRVKGNDLPQGEYVPTRPEYFIYEIDTQNFDDELLEMLIDAERFKKLLRNKRPVVVKISKLRRIAAEKHLDAVHLVYALNNDENFFSSMVAENLDIQAYGRSSNTTATA